MSQTRSLNTARYFPMRLSKVIGLSRNPSAAAAAEALADIRASDAARILSLGITRGGILLGGQEFRVGVPEVMKYVGVHESF